MVRPTGSNNLGGILGGLVESLEEIVAFAGRNLGDGDEIDRDIRQRQAKNEANPKLVQASKLALGDKVVLNDGAWEVRGVAVDSFDLDRVTVTLENGEEYDLLANAYVEVA